MIGLTFKSTLITFLFIISQKEVSSRVTSSLTDGQNFTKTCPDNQTLCEDDETCCALNTGGYGCCDPDHSRCCGDGVHCCPDPVQDSMKFTTKKISRPSGNTVNAEDNTVGVSGSTSVNLQFNSSSVNSKCPGSSFECPPDNTCCKDSDGDWACCTFPNATCCADGLSCCPSGYKCRLDIGRCVLNRKKILSPQ